MFIFKPPNRLVLEELLLILGPDIYLPYILIMDINKYCRYLSTASNYHNEDPLRYLYSNFMSRETSGGRGYNMGTAAYDSTYPNFWVYGSILDKSYANGDGRIRFLSNTA